MVETWRCVDAYVGRGAIYANTKQFHKAKEEFNLALKIDPIHSNALKYLDIVEKKISLTSNISKGSNLHQNSDKCSSDKYEDVTGRQFQFVGVDTSRTGYDGVHSCNNDTNRSLVPPPVSSNLKYSGMSVDRKRKSEATLNDRLGLKLQALLHRSRSFIYCSPKYHQKTIWINFRVL